MFVRAVFTPLSLSPPPLWRVWVCASAVMVGHVCGCMYVDVHGGRCVCGEDCRVSGVGIWGMSGWVETCVQRPRTNLGVFLYHPPPRRLFFLIRVSHWTWSSFIVWIDWSVSPRILLSPPPQPCVYGYMLPRLTFYMDAWDLNSGLLYLMNFSPVSD